MSGNWKQSGTLDNKFCLENNAVLDTSAGTFVNFEREMYYNYYVRSCFFLFLEWEEIVSTGTVVASDHFVWAHTMQYLQMFQRIKVS
jgi:hypothetical protein